MRQTIRLFMLCEGVLFIAAAMVHFGIAIRGYEHMAAGTAETVIGIVLLFGLVLSWIFPKSTLGIGLATQAFALLGTLVGVFTIAVGVGPRTLPDIAYHIIISIALTSGLIVAFRARADRPLRRG